MNKIAMMLALTAGITCVAFGYEPQRHNNSFTTNGVTYAQRGGLGASDYVVTNIDASAVGKVQSVNGMDGDVVIDAKSVGAVANDANYLAVSNRAMTALQSYTETDPRFREWVASVTNEQGIISAAETAMFVYTLGGPASEVAYSAEDITAISNGFYIGEQTLASILMNKADKSSISATDTTFSNAVLSVGLNIDTNSVAVLNEIASTFGGFPIEGTATTVGGLLAALAAAVAWLKKNKADKEDVLPRYYFTILEVVDGVLTVPPYTSAHMPGDVTAFTVAVGEGNSMYLRDCILCVQCGNVAPTITWPANFHPRTDAETDFACVAGAMNVYWISEYAQGEFVVAGWQATAGGSAV